MKFSRRLGGLVLGAASIIGASTQASALTGWQTFAYVRDQYFPTIGFISGTLPNPDIVRVYASDGSYAGPTSVTASISCYDNSLGNVYSRSLDNSFSLPRYFVWDVPNTVGSCVVRFEASHGGRYGMLSATAQARYE